MCDYRFGKAAGEAHVTEGGKDAWAGGKFIPVAGCTGASASTVAEGLEICFACGCGSYELALLA